MPTATGMAPRNSTSGIIEINKTIRIFQNIYTLYHNDKKDVPIYLFLMYNRKKEFICF